MTTQDDIIVEKHDMELDAEGTGTIEFDSKVLGSDMWANGYDKEGNELPLLVISHLWFAEEEDRSFASGEPLQIVAGFFTGPDMLVIWKVSLILDHVEPDNEERPGYNVYQYHHTVMVRKRTSKEATEAVRKQLE